MKKLIILALLLFAYGIAHAEYYRVYVKRIASNLYKDTLSGALIETRYCYEYAYGEEAVLKYEKYSYDNKLIFDSGTSCDVKAVR